VEELLVAVVPALDPGVAALPELVVAVLPVNEEVVVAPEGLWAVPVAPLAAAVPKKEYDVLPTQLVVLAKFGWIVTIPDWPNWPALSVTLKTILVPDAMSTSQETLVAVVALNAKRVVERSIERMLTIQGDSPLFVHDRRRTSHATGDEGVMIVGGDCAKTLKTARPRAITVARIDFIIFFGQGKGPRRVKTKRLD